MNHPGGRPVFLIPLFTALTSLGLLFLAICGGWFGESTGTGSRFCEASQPGLIKQPVNTWSNLGFVAAGLCMARLLWVGRYGRNANALTRSRFFAAFFTSLVILIGPCSMAMHATETGFAGWLDVFSMHLMASFITGFAAQRFYGLRPRAFTGLFLAVMAVCLVAQELPWRIPVFGHAGNLVFGIFIFTGSVFEFLNTHVRRLDHRPLWGYLSAAAILTAFLIWNLTQTGCALCDPQSVIQGHGIWHLLCALSLVFLFLYYVSEKPKAGAAVPAA